MARLPQPGGDQGTWGNVLNDYLSQVHNSDGSLKNGVITESKLDSDLQTRLDQVAPVVSVAGKSGAIALVKGDVGLGNVDNTSDANKPVSTATRTALDTIGVDPLRYGVTFDGTTDDTAAWNTVIAALTSGDVIVFPKKRTSIISSTLNFWAELTDITIIGRGSKLKLASGASNGMTMIAFLGPRSTIQDLFIDGSQVANANGIRPRGDLQTITGCNFTDCEAGGIYFQGESFGTKISLNNFQGEGYGICTHDSSTVHHVTIANNSFEGGSIGDAIEVNTPTGGASDITITGNVIRGYTDTHTARGMGIGLAKVNRFTISNNVISDCVLDGIHVEDDSSYFSISDNTVTTCGRSGVSIQIGAGVADAPRRFTVTNNTVSDCATTSGTGGIAIEGEELISSGAIIGNIIRDCGRTGATISGIDLGSGNTRLKVVSNDVSNTVGSDTAGIRWNALTNSRIVSNDCYNDQGSTAQHYGLRSYGICTNIAIIDNDLSGNRDAPIDEAVLSTASYNYRKQGNLPAPANNPDEIRTHAGAITTDAQWTAVFGNAFPNVGQWYYDTVSNQLIIRAGANDYKTVTMS